MSMVRRQIGGDLLNVHGVVAGGDSLHAYSEAANMRDLLNVYGEQM